MMMELLIDNHDISNLIGKSDNTDLRFQISQAQEIDLYKLMGPKSYNELISEKLEELKTGGSYQKDGITYTYPSIKTVVVYLAYSRYCLIGQFTDTSFGFRQRNSENSHNLDHDNRKELSRYYRNLAFKTYEKIRSYLEYVKSEASPSGLTIIQ